MYYTSVLIYTSGLFDSSLHAPEKGKVMNKCHKNLAPINFSITSNFDGKQFAGYRQGNIQLHSIHIFPYSLFNPMHTTRYQALLTTCLNKFMCQTVILYFIIPILLKVY